MIKSLFLAYFHPETGPTLRHQFQQGTFHLLDTIGLRLPQWYPKSESHPKAFHPRSDFLIHWSTTELYKQVSMAAGWGWLMIPSL